MFQNLRITTKYPVVIVTLALLASVITGFVAYKTTSAELHNSAGKKLSALLETRKKALENYFGLIGEDLRVQVQNPMVIEALENLSSAWHAIEGDRQVYFQKSYILDNPYPPGQKKKLNRANDLSHYSALHEKYHPVFRKLQEERGYYDIFLFDEHGDLIYTVTKELDFATNLNDGPWSQTNLGRVFRTARDFGLTRNLIIEDFEKYEPSNNIPASFIASPLYDDSLNFMGVLAFQIPIDRLNDVMQVDAGMEKTGEIFIVGKDLLRRSDSRFSDETLILKEIVDRESVHRALKGKSGIASFVNRDGNSVFSAFEPFIFNDIHWALIAEIDELEILAPIQHMKQTMMVGFVFIAIFVTFFGIFISRSLSRPIIEMTNAMTRLSVRDFSVDLTSSERRDEIGGMERALEVFRENAIARSDAEIQLTEQAMLLRDIVENVAYGITLFDKDNRLLIWNDRYIENSGIDRKLVVKGAHYLKLGTFFAKQGVYGPGKPEVLAQKRLDFFLESDETKSEFTNNKNEHYEVTSKKTPGGGFVLALTDVTEQRMVQKQILDQRDDLQSLNQQKNRFFSIIAHDLRSPFNALLGYSEYIKTKSQNMSSEEIVDYASSIHTAGQQVYELLENLLEWSRVQMNQTEFVSVNLGINQIISKVLGDLSSQLNSKDQRVVSSHNDFHAVGDRDMTETILRNLIGNAIKFSARGGEIIISSKCIDEFVHISVKDSGVGIDQDKVDQLFRLENSLTTTGTEGETGTGLGLLICKEALLRFVE
ncbi:PAS-domain containing protein [Kiloniella sp.]|uniref:sensor histidine kinase n=1 Tax=Kiloniella sp. TaxID=1938587 RepID=UPI003B027C62